MLPVTLARSDTDGFDVALRCRGDIYELIVNGAFAMDSAEVASEHALAEAVPADAAQILVGGLGLGFTAARLLDVTRANLVIVELSSALIEWAEAGLTPTLGRVATSDRVRLVHADIADQLRTPGRYDAILLDVDNGPDFLIHEHNNRLYGAPMLANAHDRLAPGGLLAIWSERYSPALDAALRTLGGAVDHQLVPVRRGQRDLVYAIHTLRNVTPCQPTSR